MENIDKEILKQLSSQKGDKTEIANRLVAENCIANPKILAEIAIGLENKDKKLQSDCIEVFTLVAELKPEFVVPYAENILPLLYSKETKTRWEAVHTLSFIAEKIPDVIFSVLPVLQSLTQIFMYLDRPILLTGFTLEIAIIQAFSVFTDCIFINY